MAKQTNKQMIADILASQTSCVNYEVKNYYYSGRSETVTETICAKDNFKCNIVAPKGANVSDFLRDRAMKENRHWERGMTKETGTNRFLGWLQDNKKYIPGLLSCVRDSSDTVYKNVDNFVRKNCLVAFFKYRNISCSDIVWSLDILPPAWTEGLAC